MEDEQSTKVRVTLEFDNPLGSSNSEVMYTLMDALAEFQSARHHDGASYVAKRYNHPDNPYKGERRNEKITQVNRRIFLAEQMRNGIKVIGDYRVWTLWKLYYYDDKPSLMGIYIGEYLAEIAKGKEMSQPDPEGEFTCWVREERVELE